LNFDIAVYTALVSAIRIVIYHYFRHVLIFAAE